MLHKLSYWVRLGLALCRIVCPGGNRTSCNRDERLHAKANCEATSPRKIILFPSPPLLCACLLQTVSHLRIFTLTTSKVKIYSDIGGIVRKLYIFWMPEYITAAWCCASPFHHILSSFMKFK